MRLKYKFKEFTRQLDPTFALALPPGPNKSKRKIDCEKAASADLFQLRVGSIVARFRQPNGRTVFRVRTLSNPGPRGVSAASACGILFFGSGAS